MIGAGRLRDRVRFERRGQDGDGERTGVFATQFSAPAEIVRLRGTEPVMAQRLQGVQPVVLVIRDERRSRAVNNAWRAVNARNGDVYAITSVSPSKDRGFLDVLATFEAVGE